MQTPRTMIRTLLPLLPAAASALLVAACCWGIVALATRSRRTGANRAATIGAISCAAGSLLLFIAASIWNQRAADEPNVTRLLPVPGVSASTDRGTAIPLGRPAAGVDEDDMPEGYEWRAIAAAEGRSEANCHGWVFADGDYWIPTESVDTILRDNGYEWVAAPGPGDLIVYRDERGRPLHSGVVKAVGADGFVLVERKWGLLDVFWHTPEDQAFSDDFEYWHADREGHRLRLSGQAPKSKHAPAAAKR